MKPGLVTIRTSQPNSEGSRSHYSYTLISYQGQRPQNCKGSRLQELDDPKDVIERASRILAQAFGYGDSWFTADLRFGQDETSYSDGIAETRRTDGLPIARRTETLERADKAANVGEFHHWQRAKGIAVMPRVRPKRAALIALADANLAGPLKDWLLVYALQDWGRWPRVRRFALACRPGTAAIDDAAQRILWRTAEISQDERAKALGIRATAYRQSTRAAESMLREWLSRAAISFLKALNTETDRAE